MYKLVIAEKPSVAKSLADVLGANEKRDGYLVGTGYVVSWCIGHLVQLAPADSYDPKYERWNREDLPILPDLWRYEIAEQTRQQFDVLKKLMNDSRVSEVICATDAGREGELIFRLVYEQAGCRKPVKRLWISSLEEKAIRDGMASLKDGCEYDTLYQAALCRLHADWLVGINATRLWSLMYGQKLNIGRVMTPTLALVVSRDLAISDFVSQPYYTVLLDGGFEVSSARIRNREEAERIRAMCLGRQAEVERVEKKRKTERPPKLYDLTTLQREVNRLFGFSAQQTLDYAQSLYEKQLATYPRTDSRYLTSGIAASIPSLVEVITSCLPFESGLPIPVHVEQVTDDAKVTDHHAIIPTAAMTACNLDALPQGERMILTMIAVRLLCAVGDPYVCEETEVTLNCEGIQFSAKGKTVVEMGWMIPQMTYMGSIGMRDSENAGREQVFPLISEGLCFGPMRASVKEGKTTPPKPYTEDTLLAAMESAGAEDTPEDAERKGLGTPATRAGILEKLVKEGFVQRHGDKKTKHLRATDKGKALVAVVPQQIQSPVMTAQWEHRLKRIEHGEEDGEDFLADIREMVCDLMQMGTRVTCAEAYFPSQYKRVGVCPRCGAPVIEKSRGFFCENQCCRFAIWKNNNFFSSIGQSVTSGIVSSLLHDGKVHLTGLTSSKTRRKYNATVYIEDNGKGAPRFEMEFGSGGKRERG